MKKGVLSNFAKFTEKYLCQKLFFNKVADLWQATRGVLWKKVLNQISATLLKSSLWHRCFPVNFATFLRIPFLQNTSGWLLLLIQELASNFRNVKFYPKYKYSISERKERTCLKVLIQLLMIIFCHINCSCQFLKKNNHVLL